MFYIKILFCINAVKCQKTNIENGNINCALGDDGVLNYEDTCDVTCNTGYTLTGSATRMCLSNGSWDGMDGTCKKGKNYYCSYMIEFCLWDVQC